MTTEVAIIKQENLQQIVSGAPQSFTENKASHDKCLAAGKQLLEAIQQQNGELNDELDQKVASFINKARRTLNSMNEKRSPFTKLFDQVRTQFTQIENEIDPAKMGTIPNQLQAYRNQYAAKKLKEQQEEQRRALNEKRHNDALNNILTDIKDDFEKSFQSFLDGSVNALMDLDKNITLENFDYSKDKIGKVPVILPNEFIPGLTFTKSLSNYFGVTPAEAKQKEAEAKNTLAQRFAEQYRDEMESNRDYILDRLSSKKKELEAIAKANSEEAERLEKEKAEREKKEEQKRKDEQEQKKQNAENSKKLEQQQKEMANLFSGQAIACGAPATKAKVTKKIRLLDAEGILSVISMWWGEEGCNLSIEDLMKKFKSQITYCEKLANKESKYIRNEFVEYVDDVKVK